MMKLLMQHGCSASKVDNVGNQAVHWAAVTGNVRAVAALLAYRLPAGDQYSMRSSVSFNEVNNKGESALYLAVREGHLPIVQLFFAQEIYPLTNATMKRELLDLARAKKHHDLVQFIEDDLRGDLDYGKSGDLSDFRKSGELSSATTSPEAQRVPELKHSPTNSVDRSSPADSFGTPAVPLTHDSPLYSDFWSSSSTTPSVLSPLSPIDEKPSELRLFVEDIVFRKGVDALFRLDQSGFSAIHVAAATGDLRTVQFIVHRFDLDPSKKAAQINLQDVNGTTALSHTITSGRSMEVASLLLENKANAVLPNDDGETSLHMAAKTGSPILSLILKKRVDINPRDNNGATPFMTACVAGQLEAAQRLLISGAAINLGDFQNTTPLMACTKLEQNAVALFLIENKASLDVADIHGSTVLHWAAVTNNIDVARELLKRGRKVSSKNDTNNRRETPIFLACREGHYEIVRLLMEQNADAGIADHRGRTCSMVATDFAILGLLRSTPS